LDMLSNETTRSFALKLIRFTGGPDEWRIAADVAKTDDGKKGLGRLMESEGIDISEVLAVVPTTQLERVLNLLGDPATICAVPRLCSYAVRCNFDAVVSRG
jgi:hypothetical protein